MGDTVLDASVVVGYKDWGLDRLAISVASIRDSLGSLDAEVIISDYGSADRDGARRVAERTGARHVYTPTDGVWARSRALNAGFAVSSGRILISTDADMLFSPGALETVVRDATEDGNTAFLIQCRDLPEGYSHTAIDLATVDWDELERVARLRPRWGMGGMLAAPRTAYARVRGLDERMQTYGGEDIDFAHRIRRAGVRLAWAEEKSVRMYHMWHPSTAKALSGSAEQSADVAANKRIVHEDPSFIRNVPRWRHPLSGTGPLVTVAIATRDRAGLLGESIRSVLAQTLQDFEIVVVDDGSTDDTASVVAAFADPRLRYVRQERRGIAAARNRAAVEARGEYIAVQDDDDLMLPWRLQRQIDAVHGGVNGSFGSFVNFDGEGRLSIVKSKILSEETVHRTGGAPGHGTWLLETRIFRQLGYDEGFTSGVDNNLALRLVRSGVTMRHTGEILMLRRLHPGQVTETEGLNQAAAAVTALRFFDFKGTKWSAGKIAERRGEDDWIPIVGSEDLRATVGGYLPDDLVPSRELTFTVDDEEVARRLMDSASAHSVVLVRGPGGELVSGSGRLRGAGWSDMVELRRLGVAFTAHVGTSEPGPQDAVLESVRGAFRTYCTRASARRDTVAVAVPLPAGAAGTELRAHPDWHAMSFESGRDAQVWLFGTVDLGDPDATRGLQDVDGDALLWTASEGLGSITALDAILSVDGGPR